MAIKNKDGIVTSNREKVVERCAEYYKELYYSSESRPNLEGSAENPLPEITLDELSHALKQMKNNKAPGEDGIVIDVIKEGADEINKHIVNLFNMCLQKRETPKEWNNALIILLHKKGDVKDISNYRPISLLSHMSKLFTKVIKNRIERQLDENQAREQAGFRCGYSTTDHLQVMQQLIEKTCEYELPLCLAFVDYEKASIR